MIVIKVFGSSPPCAKCKEVEKRANKLSQKYSGKIEVVKYDAISDEGLDYNVMFTPTVVINDNVIVEGEVISEGDLEKAVLVEMEK